MAKYKSMQGKEVDMDKLMQANELMPAIGNARVNTRGDKLGPGGKIVKKREDVLAEYYENNPKAIRETAAIIEPKVKSTPQPVKSTQAPTPAKKVKNQPEEETDES